MEMNDFMGLLNSMYNPGLTATGSQGITPPAPGGMGGILDMLFGGKDWVDPDKAAQSGQSYIEPINPEVKAPQSMASNIDPTAPRRGPDISQLKAYATAAYPDNPVMQQVAISQAILESGTPGRMSSLAQDNNNYFGIKSGRTAPGTGGSVGMPTQEYDSGNSSPYTTKANFAKNVDPVDSFYQHKALMSGLQRYQPVMAATSPAQAFGALQKGGYATDPNYSRKLNSVFNTYVRPAF